MRTLPEFKLIVLPRATFKTKNEFCRQFPKNAIALDGVILDKPFCDKKRRIVNFDHHNKVVREATMSTCMQVCFALKGGLLDLFAADEPISVVINDIDQDTAFAVWLLFNHSFFLAGAMHPRFNFLLELTNKWDITAGAFPVHLSDRLVREHAWVFRLYTEARCSGALYRFSASEMEENLRKTLQRISDYMAGEAGQVDLCDSFEMVHKTDQYWMYKEQGPEARFRLWNRGMKAFVALLGALPNGRKVYSVGCRSPYVDFPSLIILRNDFNARERVLGAEACWGGSSTIIGSRNQGSMLDFPELKELIDFRLQKQRSAYR